MISHSVEIFDTDAHPIDAAERQRDTTSLLHDGVYLTPTQTKSASITIGDNAWIGAKAIILKGANIGPRAIVAAGSVVTKPVPANSLFAGNPAEFIREL